MGNREKPPIASKKDIVDSIFTVHPDLRKSAGDTFRIYRTSLPMRYPFYFFNEKDGFCIKENDTLRIFLRAGHITTTELKLNIIKQNFVTETWVNDCHTNVCYKSIAQLLQLNAAVYEIGDTLTGYLDFVGLPVLERELLDSDKLKLKGKFKFVVKDKSGME